LNTGFSGDLTSAENVLLGGGDTGKPCIFMCVIVHGNTSTAFRGGFVDDKLNLAENDK
jgi:hypothetical protein